MDETATDKAVIDFADAASRIPGGIAGVKQLAPELAQECRQQLEAMRAALTAQDAERIRFAAHSIRGSAAVFSAARIEKAALALETMARSPDLSGAELELEVLDAELARLERILAREAQLR